MLEARAVARALGTPIPKPGKPVFCQRGASQVVLAIIGIGARRLGEQGMPPDPNWVCMAGLAGALDPSLAIGEVVIDPLPVGVPLPAGMKQGRIHCSDRIVATAREKAELFEQTGAAAVEMENANVRAWAERRGAVFVGVRAISDRADQALDPAVLRLVDSWGRPRPAALLATLLRRPGLIPQLLRLGSESKRAARRLGEAVRVLVAQTADGYANEP